MSEEELRAITEHFKYCIKNNVIRDEEYVLMGMEKILNLIEKQQKEIENSISKNKIRDKIKELEEDLKDFEETDNSGRFKRENSRDYDKVLVLKSIIGE